MPQFSIIIPSYNRAYILPDVLDSLKNQSFDDYEIIIVDDGSTDNTQAAVEPFLGEKTFYHQRENAGVAAARQYGLEQAKGEIITYIDSDDPVFSNYLQIAKEHFSKNSQISFALSNCHFFVELYNESDDLLSSKHVVTHEQPVILTDVIHWKKRVAMGTGLFFNHLTFSGHISWCSELAAFEDLDLIIQLASHDPNGYSFITTPLFDYKQRYGGDGLCSSLNYGDWSRAFAKLYQRHKDNKLLSSPQEYLTRQEKYKNLHELFLAGDAPAPYLKYFPEFEKKPPD